MFEIRAPYLATPELPLDDQAGEVLGGREGVAAELVGIQRKGLARQQMGKAHHLPWRPVGQHGISRTTTDGSTVGGRDRALPARLQSASAPIVRSTVK